MSYVCSDCPRECFALRENEKGTGFCQTGEKIPVAYVMRHMWEEPVFNKGGGTENIFLYGCHLKCVYCQNRKINGREPFTGRDSLRFLSPEEFGGLLAERSETDCDSVGIMTGDHLIRQIALAITPEVKARIRKPLIFNCSGYEKEETLELLRGKIDVFLPDFKYAEKQPALDYSYAEKYPEIAKKAIKKCFEMTGPAEFDENGLILKGTVIRHLILPGHLTNTLGVIDWVNDTFRPGDVVFSLMSQYTPALRFSEIASHPKLSRTISLAEHKKANAYLDAAENITLGFCQGRDAASENFVPDF